MRALCPNLTEERLDCGHWMAQETSRVKRHTQALADRRCRLSRLNAKSLAQREQMVGNITLAQGGSGST